MTYSGEIPKHLSVPNKWRLQRIARSTTKKPISLDYHPNQSMTDGNKIYISQEEVVDEEITLIVQTGSTYHESFHVLFTDFDALNTTMPGDPGVEEYVIDSVVQMFGNISEDCRVEAAGRRMFKGAHMYVQMKNFALMEYKLRKELENPGLPEAVHTIHTVTSVAKFGHTPKHYVNPRRQLRFMRRIAPALESAMIAKNTEEQLVFSEMVAYEFMKWYPKMLSENIEQAKRGMEGLVLLVVGKAPPGAGPIDTDIDEPLNAIVVILEDPDEQDDGDQEGPPINIVDVLDLRDEKKEQEGEDEDGIPTSGSGEGQEQDDGEMDEGDDDEGDDGEDEVDDGDGDGAQEADGGDETDYNQSSDFPDESERQKPGDRMIDSHPELAPETRQSMKQMMRQATEQVGKGIQKQEKAEEKLSKQDQKYVDVGNVKKVGDGHRVYYIRQDLERDIDEYRQMKAEFSRSANTIANKIRNLLLDAKASRHVRNLPSGDLDRRSLYRVDTSTSLFKRIDIPKVKDTVITILVDHSASMSYSSDLGGIKRVWASRACMAVAEILSHIPDCDFEIIGFHTRYRGQYYYLYKSYGEPYNERAKAAIGVPKSSGGNCDAAALEVAVARQDTMPQEEKIIIVICDGNPTDSPYKGMDGKESLRHAVEKFKNRKLIGIGITGSMSYTPGEYYKHYVEVKDVRRLPLELTNVIRRILRR